MVEPVSLTVGAVVAALLTKLADKSGENLADGAKVAVARLGSWLRERFSRSGDSRAVAALDTAERITDSVSVRGELAAIIDEHAASDAAFRDTLTRLLAEAEQNGAHVSSVAQTAWGSQNVQIADVRGSTITTSIGSSPETLRAPNEHR